MKEGAYDYLTKPVDPQRLKILLDKIVERQDTLREVKVLRRQLREHGTFGTMIGRQPGDAEGLSADRAGGADVRVHSRDLGESGTGKELVAQTIHQLSPRAAFPYVPINCAAIPETLLESELFGHEKGARSPARSERRQGCFELADRGTLFLDEIAEMTPATQVKLLRVLQERRFRRLGGRQEQAVDVRVIAATNVDPPEAVQKGKLREDLYYRLNVFALRLPPLRERHEDLPLLVQAFLTEFNGRAPEVGGRRRSPGDGALRKLRLAGECARTAKRDRAGDDSRQVAEFIEPKHLAPALLDAGRHEPALAALRRSLAPGTTVEDAERRLILMTLEHTRDNKTRAAEILGISLKTLHNKLNRMGRETAVKPAPSHAQVA